MVQLGRDDLQAISTKVPLLVVRSSGSRFFRASMLHRFRTRQPVGSGHRSRCRRILGLGHLHRIPTSQGQEGRLARCLPCVCENVLFRIIDRLHPEHGRRPDYPHDRWVRRHRYLWSPRRVALLWLAVQPW